MLKPELIRDTNKEGEDCSFELNPYFWECECDDNYIRARTESLHCNLCGEYEHDRPGAREPDIIRFIGSIRELADREREESP